MSGAIVASAIGVGGAIAGSAIQSSAAGKAADTQAQTAQNAAAYQKQATDQALQYQTQQNQQTQQNMAPWQRSGEQANSKLSYLLGVGGPNAGQTPYQANGQPQPQTAQVGNTSTLTNPTTGQPVQNAPIAQSNVQQAGQFSYDPATGQGTAIQPTAQTGMVNGGTQVGQPAAAAGTDAASGVSGYGSLLTPYQDFSAPTGLTYQNDPGYQARLQLGTDAIERSAAARGNVLTGATGKALDTYAQDYASNEYGNVYNRALQGYQTNAGNYYTGQNNAYSRLMGVSSQGQNAATTASSLGQSGANAIAGTITQGANNVNQQNNNAALATASGYLNQGQAWGKGIASAGNNFSNLYQLQNQNQGDPYRTL